MTKGVVISSLILSFYSIFTVLLSLEQALDFWLKYKVKGLNHVITAVPSRDRLLTVAKSVVDAGNFEDLRILMVTGAVLTPPMFEWTQKAFGGHVHLISSSGGTDVCTSCEYHRKYARSAQNSLNTEVSCDRHTFSTGLCGRYVAIDIAIVRII